MGEFVRRGFHGGIEGTDGAGKGSTIIELERIAKAEGFEFNCMKFPRYGTPAGIVTKDYLFGEFGPATKLPPRLSGVTYTIDRLVAAPIIEAHLANGRNVLDDRYICSNLAHQAAKLKTWEERKDYVDWCMKYEHEKLGIPRQDMVACLHLPKEIAEKSVVKRGEKKDDHENDANYQEEVVKTYLWLGRILPNFKVINCMHSTEYRRKTEVEVATDVWNLFKPLLTK